MNQLVSDRIVIVPAAPPAPAESPYPTPAPFTGQAPPVPGRARFRLGTQTRRIVLGLAAWAVSADSQLLVMAFAAVALLSTATVIQRIAHVIGALRNT